MYERYNLSYNATPADLHDIREEKSFLDGSLWFSKESIWWDGLMALCSYVNNKIDEIKLIPLNLGFGEKRMKRGRPIVADKHEGEKIINRVRTLSKTFKTNIDLENEVGYVRI